MAAGPGAPDNFSYILRIGKALLLGFIRSLFEQHANDHPQGTSMEQLASMEQSAREDVPDPAQLPSLQKVMLDLWQKLSNDSEITSMVQSVTGNNPLEVLANVSEATFASEINWGRIVVFFYFAYRVIAQSCSNWLPAVVDWAMGFLRDRLAAWIQQQGGWDGLLSYFGTPTWQTIAVFAAGVLIALLTAFWKMS